MSILHLFLFLRFESIQNVVRLIGLGRIFVNPVLVNELLFDTTNVLDEALLRLIANNPLRFECIH